MQRGRGGWKRSGRLPSGEDESIQKGRWSVVMNNVHICSGRPISNSYPLGPARSLLHLAPLTLKTISTPSPLSRPISLHIKLWSSEWPIVACCCCCCCCDIFGYIKFFSCPNTSTVPASAYASERNRYTGLSTVPDARDILSCSSKSSTLGSYLSTIVKHTTPISTQRVSSERYMLAEEYAEFSIGLPRRLLILRSHGDRPNNSILKGQLRRGGGGWVRDE